MSGGRNPESLWRHRDFLLLWSGQSMSLIGSQITVLALPLLAVSALGASVFEVGLLTTFGTLPWLLVSLPAGVVVDRTRKRSLMLWCDLGRAAILLTVSIAGLAGQLTIWHLYAVAMLSGACTVFFNAAYLSFPPAMLEKAQFVDATSKISTASALANVLGPGVAGFLIGLVGAARAVAVDAVSCLVSAATLLLIRHREPPPAPPADGERSFRKEVAVGLRLIVGNRSLTYITFTNSFGGFLVISITALWVPYAVRELGWSAQALGVVMGTSAIGGLLGSLLAKRLIERYGLAAVLLGTPVAFAPGQIVAGAVSPGLGGMIAVTVGFAVTSSAVLVYNIAQRAYRLHSCPPDRVGRLNATINWLQWGLRPLAGLAAGALGTWLGLQPAVLVFACLLPLCAITLWLSPLRAEAASVNQVGRR
ncbi:MFS transporter [Amycolatopsis magusensis]|uniref:MFS transporter n=1 Tax=Amycolatopsis magusensis TaxID=882444 RepID=UPI003C30D6B6